MGALNILRGSVRMEAVGAFPENMLNLLAKAGVSFWNAEPVDACTLRFSVRPKDADRVEAIAQRAMCTAKRIKLSGAPVVRRRLKTRQVLLVSFLVCFAILLTSSLFIWDVDVSGNEDVPTGDIMRALSDAGVDIGSFWPSWSGDSIKNEVLIALPELRWVGVSVDSSRAIIRVRERVEHPKLVDNDEPHYIVSAATGIVRRIKVYMGTPQVQVGDAVLDGELLVSGLMESAVGGDRYVHAQADIEAATWYELTAAVPIEKTVRSGDADKSSRWAVIIGGERLNLYVSDGKSGTAYQKTVTEYPFSWEGIFTLPITLVREDFLEYDITLENSALTQLQTELEALLTEELIRIVDGRGEVISQSFVTAERDNKFYVTLRAECSENIALEQPMSP